MTNAGRAFVNKGISPNADSLYRLYGIATHYWGGHLVHLTFRIMIIQVAMHETTVLVRFWSCFFLRIPEWLSDQYRHLQGCR